MSTSRGDFDIANAVADQLKGIEKERQERILRWVAESLSLNLGIVGAPGPRPDDMGKPSGDDTTHHRGPSHRQQAPIDIKTFVDAKKPKSDVQFTAVVAFYYHFEAPVESRRHTIDAETLQEATRLAGRKRLAKPLATLNNAKTLGYLDGAERGQFRINAVGENLVAMTLPGSEPERAAKKKGTRKSRKSKTRKR